MRIEADTIPSYFEVYGWQFERMEDDLFRTGFVGDTGHYEIWVRIAEPWVYFLIHPFLPAPDEGQHKTAVLRLLLEANHDINLAKFALDDEGHVVFSVELPSEDFDYSHFADALTALSHYADLYRPQFAAALERDRAGGP